MVQKIPNDEYEFKSYDESVPTGESSMLPADFLNSLDCPNLPPHKLILKVGTPCILIRNISPQKGLVNGTKLLIESIGNKHFIAKILNGPKSGKSVVIFKIKIYSDENDWPFKFSRMQFPIKVGFAMTANKIQGQTNEPGKKLGN